MFTKKLLDGAKQVPVAPNFMPCDHLYPINTTTEEYKANKNRMMPGKHQDQISSRKFLKDAFSDRARNRVKAEIERATLGVTIGFKMEGAVEMILEAPLEKEKTFIIMNSL